MSAYHFDAHIDGATIVCAVTAPKDIAAPVLCFSLMAPPVVVSGGTLMSNTGGYGEVLLPDLKANTAHTLVLSHEHPEFRPANRAWLPLGPYLRTSTEVIDLPPLRAGVQQKDVEPPAQFAGLRLVPPPTSWSPETGTVPVTGFTTDSALLEGVVQLADRVGLPPFLVSGGLLLTLENDPSLADEAYRLEITPVGVTLTHGTPAGAHYGAISLLMLRATHGGALPCGRIEDAPRFTWRGQHLDCARHFYQPETIHRLIDLMALFKMNRFHWHFSDDEAFRLQVECFPEIWQKTEFRGEGELVPGVFGGGPRSGGSYSKDDARALIGHAKALHIEILPEIEVPAHALAIVRAMPDLRDPADNGGEVSVQGYRANAVNPAMPKTWELLEALSLEVAELFPMAHLHLGCDELADQTWDGSPAVRELKEREGLTTRDDVQEWTMRRLAAHLSKHGIRPAAWEEAARGQNGGIGHDTLLFSWSGQGPGIEAAKAGYDVVMCPAQNAYLDMAQTGDVDDWGASWAAVVTLADTLNWSVVPDPEIAGRIKGVEGTFWSEFTTRDREIEPMIAPRLLGVATMAWSTEGAIDGEELRQLAWHHASVFEAHNWEWTRA